VSLFLIAKYLTYNLLKQLADGKVAESDARKKGNSKDAKKENSKEGRTMTMFNGK
jgi:hypothetical protein